MKLMRIGVDLAKSVFQIHGVDCKRGLSGGSGYLANAGFKRSWRRPSPIVRLAWRVAVEPIIGLGNLRRVDFGSS
ncbi:hypothetical protein P997_01674 [Pseudomonas aeruginosa 62]|nr:hypothetical protein P997_01674 [Pseudomonas aeruginosa 62]WOE59788.1 hypothetical protein PA12_gene4474 [Pseudomonas aeruginosa]